MRADIVRKTRWGFTLAQLIFWGTLGFAQDILPVTPQPQSDSQINVNWFYGSYVPKEVPLEPLNSAQRLDLYVRRTYTAKGIYIKTTLFTLHDQMQNTNPQWGNVAGGFARRFSTRQAEFIIQNSVISLGDGLLGWEVRYDRCRCAGFWSRTRHAMVRNFLTYDRTESHYRPQLFPYLGAFAGSATVTTWEPEKPRWQIRGYQAVLTQVPVGIAVNWIGEFAPEMGRVMKRHKLH